ncbi:MAG: TIGR04283 family arsenosugar biosynthesis glycosyltransferase [Aquisalimonadaceae bacterium]
MLSVIVPTLNEEATIGLTLAPLQRLRAEGHEVLLVDGGSLDATVDMAEGLVDRVIAAERGRAAQMNAGAEAARGNVLWFVHADTLVPVDGHEAIDRALGQGRDWGRFSVTLDAPGMVFRVIAWFMNARSCLSGIATGDQAIFVRRALFRKVGGFPRIPLMEDVALSSALRALGRPACLRWRVRTSARRWEDNGVWATIVLMWRLRYAYWRGVDPAELHRRYYGN